MTLTWLRTTRDVWLAAAPSGGFYRVTLSPTSFTACAEFVPSFDAEPETVFTGSGSRGSATDACERDAESRKRARAWARYMASFDPPEPEFTVYRDGDDNEIRMSMTGGELRPPHLGAM